jgi:hypothetical protein
VKEKDRGTPEKTGMLVLDAFKGHLIPEIKVTITGTSTNRPGWITSQLQVLDVAVNKPFRRSPKAALKCVALDMGPLFDPSWKNLETQCDDSLPVDHKQHGSTSHQKRL